jgi:hypothetical protein
MHRIWAILFSQTRSFVQQTQNILSGKKWPASFSPRRIANPLHAAAELGRYCDAAQRLVRSAWAQQVLGCSPTLC